MGASAKTFSRLIDLKRRKMIGIGTRMVELGSQNISGTSGEEVRSFISEFRGEPCSVDGAALERIACGGTMASLMRLCGVSYLALDIFKAEGCMLFDLNTDSVPGYLRGKANLVTNFGTSEHVIDQYQTFRTIHDLTKPGGLIYHDLPMGGFFYHGYFSYTPLFFNHLALANGYDVIFQWFSKVPIAAPLYRDAPAELTEAGWPDAGYHDVGIEYIFRKTTDASFRVPVDAGTSLAVNREFVEGKRSDVVILRPPNS
jgi:Methyltransferase domain